MSTSISTLQAAAGRFLTAGGASAWEAASKGRHEALVQAFQRKEIDPLGLEAAFAGERTARPMPARTRSTAVLELVGVLMAGPSIFSFLGAGTAMREFLRELAAAVGDPAVRAIAVLVDSPGGQ